MLPTDVDVGVLLNSDTFSIEDKDVLVERLNAEVDLRTDADVVAYAGVPGEPPPPDVLIQIAQSLLPVAEVYVNVLSTLISDTVKSAFARLGEPESEARFTVSKMDEDGGISGEVSGETTDPEVIKELVRQLGQD